MREPMLDPVQSDPLLEFDVEPPRPLPVPGDRLSPSEDPLLDFIAEAPQTTSRRSRPPLDPSARELPLAAPLRASRRDVLARMRDSLHLLSHQPEGSLIRRLSQLVASRWQAIPRIRLTVLCGISAVAVLLITETPGGPEANDPPVAALPSGPDGGLTETVQAPARPAAHDPVSSPPAARVVVPAPQQPEERDRRPTAPARQERAARGTVPTAQETPTATPRRAPTASASATTTRPAQAKGFRGSLAVESNPGGARVTFNGTLVGTTPLAVGDLPAGSGVLRLELQGHAPWSSSIRVVADEITRVSADLRPSTR